MARFLYADQAPISAPLERKTRTRRSPVLRLFISSSVSIFTPTRSALPLAALKIATLDWWIGSALSTTPPVVPFMGLGLTCFFTTFTPSTSRWSSSTRAVTVPRLPLSRPVSTIPVSPLRILIISVLSGVASSEHFGRERHDLHEALAAQLSRHRPEDAGADRLELGIEEH